MYLVDETSETVAAYAYDPYGQITFTEGDLATVNPLRYRGYYSDDETGFYYLQSRYYDPAVCRFINADSYASTGQGFAGHDAFIYCGNSPADRVDEAGTFFFTVLGAAIGGAVGFVDALITGNDPIEGAEIGAISGAIAGAGVDVGLMVAASGPVGWGVAAAAVGGVASGIVGTGMSTDWTANTVEYIAAGVTGGLLNMISLRLGPLGSVSNVSISQMSNYLFLDGMYNIAENLATGTILSEAGVWITRTATDDYSMSSSTRNNSISTKQKSSTSYYHQKNKDTYRGGMVAMPY